MSNEALRWAYAQTAGGVGPKAVLVFLAEKANGAGESWWAQAAIAAAVEASVRSVGLHLAALEAAGLIARTPRYEAGHRLADLVRLELVRPESIPADPADKEGVMPADPAPMNGFIHADSVVSYPQNLQSSNPQLNPQKELAPQAAPAEPVKASPRGARISPLWVRSDADKAWQEREAIPDEFARPVTAEFVNYWIASTGRNATKRDWSAAWKVWMSREWREKGPRWVRDHGLGTGRDPQARKAAAQRRAYDPLASAR